MATGQEMFQSAWVNRDIFETFPRRKYIENISGDLEQEKVENFKPTISLVNDQLLSII